ncbi:hypothetical protein PABG_05023 [Paracoccidioides brasiliensis Pb03]|nr:hypothetical protein PABG_05023 [Paracoccidioides brasiliensis Pb03]
MPTTTFSTSNQQQQQEQFHSPTTSSSTATTVTPPSSPPESNDPSAALFAYLSTPSTSFTSPLEDLHTSILGYLQRSGWTERVRGLALELLRAGHCDRFEEVVDTVVALASSSEDVSLLSLAKGRKRKRKERMKARAKARIVEDGASAVGAGMAAKGIGENSDLVDEQTEDGDGVDTTEEEDSAGGDAFPDIRIPQFVVVEGVKMLHEALHEVFVVEGGNAETDSTPTAPTTGGYDSGIGSGETSDQQEASSSSSSSSSSSAAAAAAVTTTSNTTSSSNQSGIFNTNGTTTSSKKLSPPSLKTDSKSGKSKFTVKNKLQENGDGRPEKRVKKA